MAFLTIDQTKCKRDGICSAECPRRIIIQEKDKSFPQFAQADEANCMACGHCVAVCPHGALSVTGVAIEDCPKIENDRVLSWDQTEQFLRSRRSIRCFKDKAMDRGTMEQLINTARYAPTASNAQNLHWTVIEGRDNLETLSRETINWMERVIQAQPDSQAADYFRPVVAGWAIGYDGILRTAQTLIIPSAPKESANGLVDLSIALSYLELAALPLGVGTCWAGLLRGAMLATPELLESMDLPEGHTWFYPMMIGYPKFKYHRLPERKAAVIHWK
ncbi:MAG: nitroreductase family protein [Deltaproteobacteria bacterium]|uniref:nitroreductase family protein n=1 Tax=Desulfobacula sp. TaxID=2593537 RepID=UPI0019B30886|nr:nitroreductase family protein [Candidatus Desulfobacula maris]MBL6996408.1 nitroreductase family protein [Desulfobacula sp.]